MWREWLLAVLVGCTNHQNDSADSSSSGEVAREHARASCGEFGTWDCPLQLGDGSGPRWALPPARPLERSAYSCIDTGTEDDEGWVVSLPIASRGVLAATVVGEGFAPSNVSVHLVSDDVESTGAGCVVGTAGSLYRFVNAGEWRLVIVRAPPIAGQAGGQGPELAVGFFPLASDGPCALVDTTVDMRWPTCGHGLDCAASAIASVNTPSIGPVAKEAHLRTIEDGEDNAPQHRTDKLAVHYAHSQNASGLRTKRTEPWAESAHGRRGIGATGNLIPALDETWYVNMYWRNRPAPGTRMLVLNPANGRAVVASGGYETGPRSSRSLGGASEEIHAVLGSQHRQPLLMGFLEDQSLPLGPIRCGEVRKEARTALGPRDPRQRRGATTRPVARMGGPAPPRNGHVP